jgi:23S rRNA (adenine2030-N6)-methyltransferase
VNYRHAYHAGNVCDVVKHATLALILLHLQKKDKGFTVLDTHAGCGQYDLTDPCALKTGEAESGVQKIWAGSAAATPELAPYLQVLRGLNPDGALRHYPGSPALARHMMRPQDTLIACELHPDDASLLRRHFHGDKQTQVHHRDGYGAPKAFLPALKERSLILIDPPFEQPDEFNALAQAAAAIHATLPQAIVALWYPIKERPTIWRFHEALIAAGLPKLLAAEFIFHPETRHDRLNGSGFVIVNPPWMIEAQLAALFPTLHALLETEEQGSVVRMLGA